jgi:predicted RNA binding protein YcfA (HicA-like mRNA interferase family)
MVSESKFSDVQKMMKSKGYFLARISDSHHIFTKKGARPFSIPVHKGKVKDYYVRQINKLE